MNIRKFFHCFKKDKPTTTKETLTTIYLNVYECKSKTHNTLLVQGNKYPFLLQTVNLD
jgi:hypothetical protein